jgi:hypothetical protein
LTQEINEVVETNVKELMSELAEMIGEEKTINMSTSYKLLIQSKIIEIADEIKRCNKEGVQIPRDSFEGSDSDMIGTAIIGMCTLFIQGLEA